MLTRFVCLANSYKEGGRCLAGVQLDEGGKPVIINRRPKWVRPICHTPHNEIPAHLTESVHVLDILQVDITEHPPSGFQSENAFFDEGSLQVLGQLRPDSLPSLCEVRPLIFGNRGKAVSEDRIDLIPYSLMMVSTRNFEVVERTSEYDDFSHTRLVFRYNLDTYDLPITDPVFLHRYKLDPDLLEGVEELYLTLSLGVNWNHWYYKLVGCVLHSKQGL
ncbi:MAG TPA: hypothetical protein VGE66_16600 [Chitinophagaceae bacterium]